MTVYVVQKVLHKNGRGILVPKFDLEPARMFGGLRYLISESASPFNPPAILADLRRGLGDFDDMDHLLLLGNPVIIGWAVAIAAWNNGRVSCLQWSGTNRCYKRVVADIFTEGR